MAAPFKAPEKQSLDEAVLRPFLGDSVPRPLISQARRSGRHNVGIVTSAHQAHCGRLFPGPGT